MTAIKPSDSALREQIKDDNYNQVLNEINSKYAEMDKYIGNLQEKVKS